MPGFFYSTNNIINLKTYFDLCLLTGTNKKSNFIFVLLVLTQQTNNQNSKFKFQSMQRQSIRDPVAAERTQSTYSLPPGTQHLPAPGSLSLSTSIIYLDTLLGDNLQLTIKLWGYPHELPLQRTGEKTHSINFRVTTNMQKLASYMRDTNIIVVSMGDRRTGKISGCAYVKMKCYIMHENKLSEFQEQFNIISQVGKNNIIGKIMIKLALEVPETIQRVLSVQPHDLQGIGQGLGPFNKNFHQLRGKGGPRSSARKLLVEPHIFDQVKHEGELREFAMNHHASKNMHNLLEVNPFDNQYRGPSLVRRKPETLSQVLEQLPENKSLADYPDIRKLQSTYGRNNVWVEQMKLNYDAACILGSDGAGSHQGPPRGSQLLQVKVVSVTALVAGINGNNIGELQISHFKHQSDKNGKNQKNSPLFTFLVDTAHLKQGSNNILLQKFGNGDYLEFETKQYKGKWQLQESSEKGVKIYLKRKDNNKRSVEIILDTHLFNNIQNNNQQRPTRQTNRKQKFCYIGLPPTEQTLLISIDPQILTNNGQGGGKGRKLIFPFPQQQRDIEAVISIARDSPGEQWQRQELRIQIDCTKDEHSLRAKSKAYGGEVCIRVLIAEQLNQLLSRVIKAQEQYKTRALNKETGKKATTDKNSDHHSPQLQGEKGNTQQLEDKHNIRPNQLQRRQKVQLLVDTCFPYLLACSNPHCMTLINKLSSGSHPHPQILFSQLCELAGMPDPQLVTQACFKELLHSDFSMLWTCFIDYRRWNTLFHKAITYYSRVLQRYNQQHLLIKKLTTDRSVLFGLMGTQRCEQLVEETTPTIYQQQWKILIRLLCRYIGDSHSHCLNIAQFQNVLLGVHQDPLFINLHQLQAMSSAVIANTNINRSGAEERQYQQNMTLLLELVSPQQHQQQQQPSTVTITNLCDTIYDILNTASSLPTLSSQGPPTNTGNNSQYYHNNNNNRISTEPRMHTDQDHTGGKLHTDGDGIIHTEQRQQHQQELQQQKYPQVEGVDECNRYDEAEGEHIVMGLKYLQLPQQDGGADMVIVLSNTHGIVCKLKHSDLPIAVTINAMCEYRLAVLDSDGVQLFYGLFVGVRKLKKIMLYPSGRSQQTAIGYIACLAQFQKKAKAARIAKQQHDHRQEEQEIVLQIRDNVKYEPSLPLSSSRRQNNTSSRRQANRNNTSEMKEDILIGGQSSNNKQSLSSHQTIAYKILAAKPQIPQQEELQWVIQIAGAPQTIRYPYSNLIGRIDNHHEPREQTNNHYQDSDRLEVTVFNSSSQNRQKIQPEYLHKHKGVHELCFVYESGQVALVLTIELAEYFGEEVFQEEEVNNTIEKVILLNMYHMESVREMEGGCTKDIRVVISGDAQCSKPIYNRKHRTGESEGFQNLRSSWLGLTVRLQASPSYYIYIYSLPNQVQLEQQQQQQLLLCTFAFKMKFEPHRIGVHTSKGYLVDAEAGFRMAIAVRQINYNDVFSTHEVGKGKFQSLLKIFQCQYLFEMREGLVLQQSSSSTQQAEQRLKRNIVSSFGFTNTQLHLLFSLQVSAHQFVRQFVHWDVTNVQCRYFLRSYSLKDLYNQYQIFDFTNCGLIPYTKAQLVSKLIFKSQGQEEGNHQGKSVPIEDFVFNAKRINKGKWVHDLANIGGGKGEEKQYVDYLFILWSLRELVHTDEYFTKAPNKLNNNNNTRRQSPIKYNPNILEQTYINKVLHSLPSFKKQSGRSINIKLLSFANCRVDGQPATLIFYINGQKMAEPIPRCVNYVYENAPSLATNWPVLLKVKNKKYGIKELFVEEEVCEVSVETEQVEILGGTVHLQFSEAMEVQGNTNNQQKSKWGNKKKLTENEQAKRQEQKLSSQDEQIQRRAEDSQDSDRPRRNLNSNILLNTTSAANNKFRQSRRQKWDSLKNSKAETNRIASILTHT